MSPGECSSKRIQIASANLTRSNIPGMMQPSLKSFISYLARANPEHVIACRDDTWSLGVCNGCQLMALLGWVPGTNETYTPFLPDKQQPRFIHNKSGRFESRWSTVTVKESPAIMLKVISHSQIASFPLLEQP